jgi:outer membrane protein assembly factor BamB
VTAGGLALFSGKDGVVRAIDAASGQPRWTAMSGYPQDRVRVFTDDAMVIHSVRQGNNVQAHWLPADILCYDRGAPPGNSPPRWKAEAFVQCTALAVAKNAVVIGGADPKRSGPTTYGLMALDLVSGRKLWAVPLKAAPAIFGIAIDRRGRVIASLEDGSVLAFGG